MNKELLEAAERIIRSEFMTVRQKAVAVLEMAGTAQPDPADGAFSIRRIWNLASPGQPEPNLPERMAQVLRRIQSSTSSQSWGYYGTYRAKKVILGESECVEINLLLAAYDAQKAASRG